MKKEEKRRRKTQGNCAYHQMNVATFLLQCLCTPSPGWNILDLVALIMIKSFRFYFFDVFNFKEKRNKKSPYKYARTLVGIKIYLCYKCARNVEKGKWILCYAIYQNLKRILCNLKFL